MTMATSTSRFDRDMSSASYVPEVMERSDLARQPSFDDLSAEEQSVEKEYDHPLDSPVTKKETKDVLHLKLLVLLILVVSAATIASGVFLYITKGETSQFEAKYSNDATKVLHGVGSSLHRTLGLLDSLAVTFVSYAQSQNSTWPFVSLPDFGARMAKVLPLTDAIVCTLLPVVRPEKRKEWEVYSLKNDEWVNKSIALQETWSGFYGPISYEWQPRGVIYGDDGDIESNVRYGICFFFEIYGQNYSLLRYFYSLRSRIMLPAWQYFPVVTKV
jgi:hypothetical protein